MLNSSEIVLTSCIRCLDGDNCWCAIPVDSVGRVCECCQDTGDSGLCENVEICISIGANRDIIVKLEMLEKLLQ